MRYVVLPQAIESDQNLAGQFITLVKDSSLVALISIQELSFLAMEIAISEQRFLIWISGWVDVFRCLFCVRPRF